MFSLHALITISHPRIYHQHQPQTNTQTSFFESSWWMRTRAARGLTILILFYLIYIYLAKEVERERALSCETITIGFDFLTGGVGRVKKLFLGLRFFCHHQQDVSNICLATHTHSHSLRSYKLLFCSSPAHSPVSRGFGLFHSR